jgi:hypothetical protein
LLAHVDVTEAANTRPDPGLDRDRFFRSAIIGSWYTRQNARLTRLLHATAAARAADIQVKLEDVLERLESTHARQLRGLLPRIK